MAFISLMFLLKSEFSNFGLYFLQHVFDLEEAVTGSVISMEVLVFFLKIYYLNSLHTYKLAAPNQIQIITAELLNIALMSFEKLNFAYQQIVPCDQ